MNNILVNLKGYIKSSDNDLLASLRLKDLWLFLAWQDIRLRYRRSVIGPFWITLNMVVFCVSLGVVYSALLKVDIQTYIPFLTIGYVIWSLIANMLSEFPNLYIDNYLYIKDIKINPLVIVFRAVTRHVIVFVHNILIIILIYFYFKINPGVYVLYAIVGFLLVLLNLITIGIILSIVGARFRDISQINQNLILIFFFITPITWFPTLISQNNWVIIFNPFYYYLDITRSPLLGHSPDVISWIVAILTLTFFSLIAIWVYRINAKKIPFWL